MDRKAYIVSIIVLMMGIAMVSWFWVANRPVETSSSKSEEAIASETPVVSEGVNKDHFSFGVQGDSHPERAGKMFSSELYETTLRNVKNATPAFYFLMGDDFSIEKLIENGSYSQQTVDEVYLNQRRYLDALSVPKYLVNGNHEQEAKYLLDGTDNNPAVQAQNAREKYFDSPGVENGYYSFMYGDALFVVIDFYWHSDIAVDNTAGETKTAGGKGSRNLWDVTLGDTQYRWLKQTLEQSTAKYKFVFTHHVLGTGRGGIEEAKYYEWGGYDRNGIWGFDTYRPGWEMPIQQLMAKNGVTIFFQGHDHLFAKQELDGVIYQEVPTPADDTYTAFNRDAYKTGTVLPDSGFLNVTVSPVEVKVDYVKSFLPEDESGQNVNGSIGYSYSVK
ncbi:MAG: metallophosphoesterase [Candidatus Moraniibacteriota bacterium]